MVYRNSAGRLGAGFISVYLKSQKRGFYFPVLERDRHAVASREIDTGK